MHRNGKKFKRSCRAAEVFAAPTLQAPPIDIPHPAVEERIEHRFP